MEQCPNCGFVQLTETITHNCFENVSGSLGHLPGKKWHYLQDYRNAWSIFPYSLRHRVAEQQMAFDYLWSLDEWLSPKLTLQKGHKFLAILQISSIYEGVLSYVVKELINSKRTDDFMEAIIVNRKNIPFHEIISYAFKSGIIDEQWKSYLNKLRETRNWIHLSNQESTQLKEWMMESEYQEFIMKLKDFRDLIRNYTFQ